MLLLDPLLLLTDLVGICCQIPLLLQRCEALQFPQTEPVVLCQHV